jgi:hypothetical protein
MPTADATLLPPVPFSTPAGGIPSLPAAWDRATARHLDDVGVEAVLGAMIEQRRRSSRPPAEELADLGGADDAPSRGGGPADPDAFLKVR